MLDPERSLLSLRLCSSLLASANSLGEAHTPCMIDNSLTHCRPFCKLTGHHGPLRNITISLVYMTKLLGEPPWDPEGRYYSRYYSRYITMTADIMADVYIYIYISADIIRQVYYGRDITADVSRSFIIFSIHYLKYWKMKFTRATR